MDGLEIEWHPLCNRLGGQFERLVLNAPRIIENLQTVLSGFFQKHFVPEHITTSELKFLLFNVPLLVRYEVGFSQPLPSGKLVFYYLEDKLDKPLRKLNYELSIQQGYPSAAFELTDAERLLEVLSKSNVNIKIPDKPTT